MALLLDGFSLDMLICYLTHLYWLPASMRSSLLGAVCMRSCPCKLSMVMLALELTGSSASELIYMKCWSYQVMVTTFVPMSDILRANKIMHNYITDTNK